MWRTESQPVSAKNAFIFSTFFNIQTLPLSLKQSLFFLQQSALKLLLMVVYTNVDILRPIANVFSSILLLKACYNVIICMAY